MPKRRPTGRRPAETGLRPEHLYSVLFKAETIRDLAPVMAHPGVDLGCRHPRLRYDHSGVHISALLRGDVAQYLMQNARGWTAEVISDQTIAGEEALKHVSKGDRFRKGGVLPEGAGRLVD